MHLLIMLLILQPRVAQNTTLDPFARGVLAIRGHMKHLRGPQGLLLASSYAKMAKKVASEKPWKGRIWVSPQLLLALGAQESDYKPSLRRGWDCGMLQNNVVYLVSGKVARMKLCTEALKSPIKSMRLAMGELLMIDNRYCKRRFFRKGQKISRLYWRCLLNNYNQGPRYYKEENCHKDVRACYRRSRYYLSVLCFKRGIELMKRPRKRCRRISSMWDLRRVNR